jgi:hypothetical protein
MPKRPADDEKDFDAAFDVLTQASSLGYDPADAKLLIQRHGALAVLAAHGRLRKKEADEYVEYPRAYFTRCLETVKKEGEGQGKPADTGSQYPRHIIPPDIRRGNAAEQWRGCNLAAAEWNAALRVEERIAKEGGIASLELLRQAAEHEEAACNLMKQHVANQIWRVYPDLDQATVDEMINFRRPNLDLADMVKHAMASGDPNTDEHRCTEVRP